MNDDSSANKSKRNRILAPYEYSYRLLVPLEWAGKSLSEFYTQRFAYKTPAYWENLVNTGFVTLNGKQPSPSDVLQLGDELLTLRPDVEEPPVNDRVRVICSEDGFYVVNKPAPLPVHPSGRYFKNTLLHVLRETHPETLFHTIHRLDAWTTGVQVLATDSRLAGCLHTQVEKRAFKKAYAVVAIGDFGSEPFTVDAAIGRVAGPFRGTGADAKDAKASITHFEPLLQRERDGQKITLLKAIPITGRTNQIRVHIKSLGGWIINDPLYSPDPVAENEIEFMGLHCREMAFRDLTGSWRRFVAEWPEDYTQVFSQEAIDQAWVPMELQSS